MGKTDLGKVLAQAVGHDLIRLQCYEGLDESKALYEWEYAKQLLYTQILKDKIGEVLHGARGLAQAVERIASEDDVFFSDQFILPRPLLRAIRSEQPSVLLIDEIDKADAEFEAFLLELLSDFQITVPELGTLKAKHIPLVILTSNNAREMSDALKRRCLHLYIDFPGQGAGTGDHQDQDPRRQRQAGRAGGQRRAVVAQARSRRRPPGSAKAWTGSRRSRCSTSSPWTRRWSMRRWTPSSSMRATCARPRKSSRTTWKRAGRGAVAESLRQAPATRIF